MMKKTAILVGLPLVGLMTVGLTSCASTPPPSSWVGKAAGEVIYLNWTDSNGALNGTAEVAKADASDASKPVGTSSEQLTGTEANGKITLRFGGQILGTTASGTVSSTSLNLELATDGGVATAHFAPGAATTYNAAVSKMMKATVATQQASAQNAAQSELATVVAAFPGEEGALTTDLQKIGKDRSRLAADWSAMQSAGTVSGSCIAADAMNAYADTYDTVGADLSDLSGDIDQTGEDDNAFAEGLTNAGAVTHALYTSQQDAAVRAAAAFDTKFHAAYTAANDYFTTVTQQSNQLDNTIEALPGC